MNHELHLLTKALAQSVSRTILWLVLVSQFGGSMFAEEFKRSALIDLSDPDPFGSCPGGLPFQDDAAQEESSLAVNPINPKNIVAVWIGGKAKGIVAAGSFDGGKHWQQIVPPGMTSCTGGALEAAVDPWVSFAPNGDLYL